MKTFCSRSYITGICGDITTETQNKWAPRTLWSCAGRGLVIQDGSGFSVRDAGGKLIAFEGEKEASQIRPIIGQTVQVWHRSSPLGYNAYYDSESVWLEPGETQENLPAPYPETPPPNPVAVRLFGIQADQAACLSSV